MARFRLVEIDEDGNVIKEHYRSPMFPGDKWNKDFDKDYAVVCGDLVMNFIL